VKRGAKSGGRADPAFPARRGGPMLWPLLLGLILISIDLHADDELRYPVSWDAVSGAGGYLVEVKDQGQEIILTRTVEKNRIELSLSPGRYLFRVTTLNRFMRNESATRWIAFQINAAKPPAFLSITPDAVFAGKEQSLAVSVDNFSSDGSATIVSPSGGAVPVRVDRQSKSALRIRIPPLNEAGKYSLILTNPPDLAARIESAFQVRNPDPIVTGLSPDRIQSDRAAHTLRLSGDYFSPKATVSMIVDGKYVELPGISREAGDLVITLPAALKPGEYRLFVRNEPDADPVQSPILTVFSPDLNVTRLEPDQFRIDHVPASLRLFGGSFSPHATVSMTVDGNRFDLPVVSNEPGELRVDLPEDLVPGDYTLTVHNSPDARGADSPLLRVIPLPPVAQEKAPVRDLLVSGGWNYLILLSRWADVYSSSPQGAEVGVDFFFTPNRVPTPGASVNVGARVSGQYCSFANDTDVFVGSTLTMYSLTVAPSLELAFSFLKLRLYCGGGVVYSSIEGGDSEGEDQSGESFDLLAIGRLALDVPISGFLRAEVAVEYRHFFLTVPLDAFSLATGLAFAFPLY
jgi:hypothetical protein